MMICDDHSHSKLFGADNSVPCRNAIIAGDNGIYSLFASLLHHITAQTITVSLPMGHTPAHIRPQPSKSQHQNRSRHHTIHIVIPDHLYLLVPLYLLFYNIQRQIQIINVMGGMQIIHRRIQIIIYGVPVIKPSLYQNLC